MRIDLHNHTTRCNHATGTIDEYVQRAIELGIDIFGFSEHAPMDFDEGYRLGIDEMQEYVKDVLEARDKYHSHIDILLGYEVDWLPGHMEPLVLESEVDYLIGSVHFIDKWGFDNPEFIGGWNNHDVDEIWQAYFQATENMVESGYFDIVGHLDLIKVFKFMPKGCIKEMASSLLQCIKKSQMVVEINSAGLRKPIAELYPSRELLENIYDLGIHITFSSDAHSVAQVGSGYDVAKNMAWDVGYTQAVTFRNRQRQLVTF